MKHLLLLVLLTVGSAISHAQSDDSYGLGGRWGLGVGAGMTSVTGSDTFKDGALELDSKAAYGLWGRYHLTDRFGLELAYTRLQFEFAPPALADLDPVVDVLDFNLGYRMWPTKMFHVLFQAGVGYARITDLSATAPDNERDDIVLKGRIGLEYMATHDLMIALYGDYYKINLGSGDDSEIRVAAPMLGVTYYFGGKRSPGPDLDHDGVTNMDDKCPETLPNTPVGPDGCDVAPAKLDTDKDGVMDSDDRCPGTPAGQQVNEFGCAKTEKLEITLNVQFKTGSSVVDPQFVGDLEKFAEFMNKYPDTKAEIEGHTDNTGAEKLNYTISQKRAQSVVNYLVKNFKIDKKRLKAKGFGPSQPVADNSTEDGRTKNRRVVAHVITVK